ncbi:hypothetical protein [Edaphobacter flagellatus]|uniref:hypothetical protein n=1 Tax=Edaphobacter flagellatus TaxID=1933044 RepID=UPI0021B4CD52|nr:hypothetical protein [Edaphobacter flagellatus]
MDRAISRGVDLTTTSRKGKRTQTDQSLGRRDPSEAELLKILSSVFETYLITLPSVTESLSAHLRERYKIEHCEIDIDRSLLGDELQLTGRARVEAAIPAAPKDEVKIAIREIGRIARERVG